MKRALVWVVGALQVLAILLSLGASAFASGELAVIRAPEELPEGDDVTVLVSATARETGIDRVLAVEYPANWTVKRCYRVEAGGTDSKVLPPFREMTSRFTAEPGTKVETFADNVQDFDPNAPGIAYFVVFSTSASADPKNTVATVKAALVERTDPEAHQEIDKKTHKPKPRNTEWRMVYPPKGEFSFAGVTGRRFSVSVRMLKVLRTSRSLRLDGPAGPHALLHTRPDVLQSFFAKPFSVEFWFRTTSNEQQMLRLTSDNGEEYDVGLGLLGQPVLSERRPKVRTIAQSKVLVNDGAWHNFVLSRDSTGEFRILIDAESAAVVDPPEGALAHVSGLAIGAASGRNEFELDELRLLSVAYREPSDYEQTISTSARDTMSNLFAAFHFDEFGSVARSSVALMAASAPGAKPEFVPVYFALDSLARLTESTSPVQLDPVMLSADLVSPTKVSINWHTTSEFGIREYRLERRIGTFGAFEKVLLADAKHGMKTAKRGQSIISRNYYTATEELPKLNGDIELYYRIAIVGYNDKEPPVYSQPIKLEYGSDRDVFVEQNDPNPFNPTTTIAIRVTKPTIIRLSVFDIIGREVAVLVNGKVDPGRHTYTLDATNWPGGIYFYKVKTAKATVTRKMVLAK